MLLHQGTLIHDDLQDGDTTRRGQETVWVNHGKRQAINAGDLLLMLPYLAIAQLPDPVRGAVSHILATHAIQTVLGQGEENDLLVCERVSWNDYLKAIQGKTGSLFALPVHGAATLAGCDYEEAAALADAFVSLGVLFQLQDDVLDLYGDKGRKMIGCDLYEGKVSGLVVAHLERRPTDRVWLLNLLNTPREHTLSKDVDAEISAFRESGALSDVLDTIDVFAEKTVAHPALKNEPALRALAADAVKLALRPIEQIKV